jgi:TPR repeat protein
MFRQLVIATALVLAVFAAGPQHVSAQAEAATTWAYCFSTDTRQCSVAGRHYLEGTGGAQVTPSWAQLAWQHGCEHEDGESCRELGLLHDQGRIVAQSNERAYRLFGRGCQLGSMNSCHEQARMLRLGRGVQINVSEANRLDGWACDHGSSAACVQMANVYAQGQGVQSDAAESRRLLQRACELGDAGACLGSLAAAAADSATGGGAPQQQPAQPAGRSSGQTVNVPTPPPGYGQQPQQPQPQQQQPQNPVMDPRVIQNAINAVMPQMTRCYERRARRVNIAGTVALQWRVDARGRPVELAVNPQLSTIQDRWMQRCVQQAAARMRFDPAPWRTSEPVVRSFAFNQ